MSKSKIIAQNQLSPQQQQSLSKIISIQDFYKLTDHKKLISIILDQKLSSKFFSTQKVMLSNIFDTTNKQVNEKQKNRLFAQKYSYQKLVQKFPRPKAGTNDVILNILSYKMKKQIITSHQTRKNIWLLASGAKFAMRTNKGLYDNLVKYPDYPQYYERQINLDLNRTVSKSRQTCKQQINSLKNILIAFSRKNPYVGYCQGLNFVAYFILMMQFTQQQSFWLLCQIVETIIPMDYYTNMIGVVCDQQIFIEILSILKPKIIDKFKQVDLNASVLSIQWFVCLFTSSLPVYLVKILWDRLFVQGISAFIKAGIIIMCYFQNQILATTEFHQIILILQKGTKNFQIKQEQFNAQFEKIYINARGLKLARQLYRQIHIMEKLAQKTINKKRKQQKIQCKHEWPICLKALQKSKRDKAQVQTWIFRQQGAPKLIHDYLQNTQKMKTNYKSTVTNGSLIKQKDLFSNGKLKKEQQKQMSQYVIGRVVHICDQRFPGFTKKYKKGIDPLKTILEVSQPENPSQYLADKESDQFDEEQVPNITKQLKRLSFYQSQYNSQVMRSQTVQFFTNFAHNNKELADIITLNQKQKTNEKIRK